MLQGKSSCNGCIKLFVLSFKNCMRSALCCCTAVQNHNQLPMDTIKSQEKLMVVYKQGLKLHLALLQILHVIPGIPIPPL